MMDFEERFGGPVVLARQIRLRWNRSKNDSIRCNSMPFLVRCLSYIRNAKHAKQNKFTRVPSKSTERLTIAQLISNWRRCRKTSRLEPEVIDLTSDTDSPKDKSCEKRKIEAICETSAIVYFYYLYYESNFPSVQVEIVTDLRCPLCSIQLPSEASFILHCRTFHFGLHFDCGKDERNKLHVLVRGDPSLKLLAIEKYNKFVFCSSRKRRKAKNVPFIKRPASTAALLDPIVRRSKIAQLEGLNAEAGVINQYLRDDKAPLRQYYSSRTNLPLIGLDWNYDSDDDAPEDWLTQEKDEMLDDFDDVSCLEKVFIKLWNAFITSWTVIPDYCIPSKCLEFARSHATVLIKENLREKFLLHLFHLWDLRLLSSDHISTCMAEIDASVGAKKTIVGDSTYYSREDIL